jgi:hypothetical protein
MTFFLDLIVCYVDILYVMLETFIGLLWPCNEDVKSLVEFSTAQNTDARVYLPDINGPQSSRSFILRNMAS